MCEGVADTDADGEVERDMPFVGETLGETLGEAVCEYESRPAAP